MLTNIKEIKQNALKITDQMLPACSNPDRWNFELADLDPEPDNHVEIAMYYDAATDTVNYERALYFADTWTVPDLDKYQLFNFIEIPNGPISEKDLKFELTSSVQETREKINKLPDEITLAEIEKDKHVLRNFNDLLFYNEFDLKKVDINYSLKYAMLELLFDSDQDNQRDHMRGARDAQMMCLILDSHDVDAELNPDTRKWLLDQLVEVAFRYSFYDDYGEDVEIPWDAVLDVVRRLDKLEGVEVD